MLLYSGSVCCASHRVRIVLAEKGIQSEVQDVVVDAPPPDDLVQLNPYGSLPTLVDRELALYDPGVIIEYLDERFPHPPLMPVDPVSRAKTRLTLHRIQHDWYTLLADLQSARTRPAASAARQRLRESLVSADELFRLSPFFLSEEFSVLDCAVLPLLWRLEANGVAFNGEAPALQDYIERLFVRPSFQDSLSDEERGMRNPAHLRS